MGYQNGGDLAPHGVGIPNKSVTVSRLNNRDGQGGTTGQRRTKA
jgi:hypothetical protein